jgi:hypothetical protein
MKEEGNVHGHTLSVFWMRQWHSPYNKRGATYLHYTLLVHTNRKRDPDDKCAVTGVRGKDVKTCDSLLMFSSERLDLGLK